LAVLDQVKRQWALRQAQVIVEPHLQLPLQRFDEFLLPFGDELVLEWLHGRIIPQLALRQFAVNLAQFRKVRRRYHHQRVVRQQLFRSGNRKRGTAVQDRGEERGNDGQAVCPGPQDQIVQGRRERM